VLQESDLSTTFSYKDFEEQLCALLSDGTGKVILSRLIRGIRSAGLWKNDPRLAESIAKTERYFVGVPDTHEVQLSSICIVCYVLIVSYIYESVSFIMHLIINCN